LLLLLVSGSPTGALLLDPTWGLPIPDIQAPTPFRKFLDPSLLSNFFGKNPGYAYASTTKTEPTTSRAAIERQTQKRPPRDLDRLPFDPETCSPRTCSTVVSLVSSQKHLICTAWSKIIIIDNNHDDIYSAVIYIRRQP